MDSNNSMKSILITGASSGIGKACSVYFAEQGYQVFAGVRNVESSIVLRNEISSERLQPIILDITNTESIHAAFSSISEVAPQGLTGLINNAGIPLAGPLEYIRLDQFRDQLEVNVIGLIAVTQTFLPLIRKCEGRIINMGSISGRASFPFLAPYASTKFALEAITDALRVELKPWNIFVSIIEPGNVDTAIREKGLQIIKKNIKMLPSVAHDLYGPVFNSLNSHAKRRSITTFKVVKTVEHAIEARNPRARYLLGKDAKIIALIQKLPTPIRDAIIMKQLPIYGK